MTCPLCDQLEALHAHGASPRSSGRVQIDRAALRHALGARDEVLERAVAKAAGRPTANVGVVWRFFTTSVYKSGDLPVIATREALQNGLDAIKAAIRHRQVRADDARFAVTWSPSTRSLTWEDNGIGMDAETILGKFLALGESGKREAASSGEAAGGFGVAKAVILGVSKSFRWEMHTRDNLAVARGADADVEIFEDRTRQGTRITVHDLDEESYWHWDRARGGWVGLEDRIRELLGANDLPDVKLLFNGAEVSPLFSRRGGAKVKVEANWGRGTSASIKAYRRAPGNRGGAYYVRLNGLFQYKQASYRGGLKADFVIDLSTTVRPGDPGYPLNAARDALQGAASHAFEDLAEEVEKENESAGRSEDDEIFDPESDDPAERAGSDELGAQLAAAFADEDVQRALGAAAGGILDYYAEQAKNPGVAEPIASVAPRGSKANLVDTILGPVLPAGFKAAVVPLEPDLKDPDQNLANVIRSYLLDADEAVASASPTGADRTWVGRQARGIFPPSVEMALERVAAGEADLETAAEVEQAIERAMDSGLSPGGGGLFQIAGAPKALAALDEATGQKRARKNPFGAYAGLRISKKTYDRAKARRFKASFAKWIPYLLAWDGVLRVVAAEARVRKRFKPGFVLDDNLVGLAAQSPGGQLIIYLHPDRFAQVVKAHRERPIAIAAFLHGVAIHELTHADGRMGQGHDEAYISAREDLGHATAHLLPALAALVSRVLKLPVPPDSDAARAERLAAHVAKLEGQVKEQRSKLTAANRQMRTLQEQVAFYTTPGTRVAWSTVREWLAGWAELDARPPSTARHLALAAHLEALPDELVAQAGADELDRLEALLRTVRPTRGRRQNHPTTRLLDAIDRARHGARRGPDPQVLLNAAVAFLRARPPAGVNATEIDGFLARNRPALLRMIAVAFGGRRVRGAARSGVGVFAGHRGARAGLEVGAGPHGRLLQRSGPPHSMYMDVVPPARTLVRVLMGASSGGKQRQRIQVPEGVLPPALTLERVFMGSSSGGWGWSLGGSAQPRCRCRAKVVAAIIGVCPCAQVCHARLAAGGTCRGACLVFRVDAATGGAP